MTQLRDDKERPLTITYGDLAITLAIAGTKQKLKPRSATPAEYCNEIGKGEWSIGDLSRDPIIYLLGDKERPFVCEDDLIQDYFEWCVTRRCLPLTRGLQGVFNILASKSQGEITVPGYEDFPIRGFFLDSLFPKLRHYGRIGNDPAQLIERRP